MSDDTIDIQPGEFPIYDVYWPRLADWVIDELRTGPRRSSGRYCYVVSGGVRRLYFRPHRRLRRKWR